MQFRNKNSTCEWIGEYLFFRHKKFSRKQIVNANKPSILRIDTQQGWLNLKTNILFITRINSNCIQTWRSNLIKFFIELINRKSFIYFRIPIGYCSIFQYEIPDIRKAFYLSGQYSPLKIFNKFLLKQIFMWIIRRWLISSHHILKNHLLKLNFRKTIDSFHKFVSPVLDFGIGYVKDRSPNQWTHTTNSSFQKYTNPHLSLLWKQFVFGLAFQECQNKTISL